MAQSPLDSWDTSAFEFQDALQGRSDRAEKPTTQSVAALVGILTAKQSHNEALAYVKRTLFNKDELFRWNNSQVPQFQEDVLPDTLQALESSPQFQTWFDSRTYNPSILLLTGEPGTGKSSFVNALKRKLDGIRALTRDNDATTFFALHKFASADTDQKSTSLSKDFSELSYALKCMALQVASQNRAYAKELRQSLQADQRISQSREAGALWTDLRFSSLNVPPDSTLYLMFDGLTIVHEEAQILSLADQLFANSQPGNASLKIHILFTGDKETLRLFRLPLLKVTTLTESLIRNYVVRQLEKLNIFQDKDQKSCANQQYVIEHLARPDYVTFTEIRENLQSLHDAIEQNEPRDRLDEILQRHAKWRYPWSVDAKEVVERTTSRLSPRHLAELNSIFAWYLYCERPLTLSELEAALHVENEHESFEPLASKMKARYSDLITSYGDFVCVQTDMQKYLERLGERSSDAIASEGYIADWNMSVKNVTEAGFRQFVWNLNQEVSTGKLDLTSYSIPRPSSLRINKFEAQLKIVRLCLKLLNEGWDQNTKALFNYVRDYLPKHLSQLANNIGKIPPDDKKFIGQNLAALLRDPYHLLKEGNGFGNGENWLTNPEDIDNVRYFLSYTQDSMQSRERTWTRSVLNESEETLPAMKQWAELNGRLWLQSEPTLKFHSIAKSFKWLNTFIEAAISAEDRSDKQKKATQFNAANVLMACSGNRSMVFRNGILVPYVSPVNNDNNALKENVIVDKVERALRWLEQQHMDIKRDNKHHLIVAATYHAIGEFISARTHFEIATHDDIWKKYALFGLAKTCFEEDAGDENEGFKYMRDVIELVSPGSPDNARSDTNLYINCLTYLGTAYYNRARYIDAIKTWKELLILTPGDYKTRKEVFRCMCIWGDSTEATVFLEQWLAYTKQSGSKGLAELFCQDGVACAENFYILSIRQNQKLLMLLEDVASNAARLADRNFDVYGGGRPSIMYYQGQTLLMSAGANHRDLAQQVWEEALYCRMPLGHDPMHFQQQLQPIAEKLVQFKLDLALAELQANPGTTMERKAALSKDFTEYINSPAIQRAGFRAYEDDPAFGYKDDTAFVRASFAALMGDLHEARSLWSSTMARALNYMTSGDVDNELQGVYWLIRSFPVVHDKISLLTAFSMCDRQRRRASTDSLSSRTANAASHADEQTVFRDGQTFHCPACSTNLNSCAPEGLWMCMFCARLELCSDCYRQFKSGEQNLWFCNPIHDYVHLVHTGYTEEEIAPGKVLIDWEYEPLQDGTFARRGGRIVDIAEWMDILRKEWNIPPSDKSPYEGYQLHCIGI